MSHSLVLIATETPPVVPANTQGAALRILRLSQPLAAHDAGALRLVSLFERAQRVAHLWPRDSSPHTIQLAQPSPDGDFSIIETVSAHPTEKSGTNELRRYPSPAPSTSESVPSKWRSGLSPHKKLHRAKSTLKTSNDRVDYKPFDAIINFLPHGLPDKALLKHAILVTTLSPQFLASPTYISTTSPQTDSRTCSSHSPTNRLSIPSPSHSNSSASSSSSGSTADTSPCSSPQPRRSSKLATSTLRAKNCLTLLFHSAPPPPLSPEVSNVEESWKVKNAHLVHVLPPGWSPDFGAESYRGGKRASLSSLSPSALAGPSRSAGYIKAPARGTGGTCKPKLVQSIEQFLLSFAYPLGSLVSGSDLNSGSCTGLSSPSSNLNQRPKSALILSPAYEKEHAPPRAFSLPTPSFSTSNLININTPLKPVPFLLAPGVFASCASKSNVRSRYSLPEEVLEQNHDQDTRGDAYMDTHSDPETTALTIGEIILLGALDFDHTRPGTGPGNGKAWIGDVGDVIVAGGGPDPGLSSGKVGMGKEKGCEVAVVNTEMMQTTERNLNGLLTPPESLSSNNSTESVEEEEEGIDRTGHTQKYARPIPPALSTYSPPTHLDDHGNQNSTLDTRSNLSKRMSFASSISILPPTPASTILKSKQTNNTLDSKVKDKNSNRFSDSLSFPSPLPLPSKSPVQLPPLVVHCDRAPPPRGSGDSYDLGVGHGVSVPPMTVSIKPGSRTASGSGMGSAMIPLQTQGDDACRSAYGKMRSPNQGSERKGFVASALRKIGLWNKW